MTSEYRTTMAGGEKEPMEEQPSMTVNRIDELIAVTALASNGPDRPDFDRAYWQGKVAGLEQAKAAVEHYERIAAIECSWCGEKDCELKLRPQGCWKNGGDDYPF